MSSSTMSVEEATYYWYLGLPEGDSLYPSYPQLETDEARLKAWNEDNPALIKEAMTVYMAAHPEDFPPGVSVDHSGSLFSRSTLYRAIRVYSDCIAIYLSHEGFHYTVTTPSHVAALHAVCDPEPFGPIMQTWNLWELKTYSDRPSYLTALAYILANYDTRKAWKPRRMVVPEGWHPDIWPFIVHPGEEAALESGAVHDPVRFPLKSDVTAAAHAAGKYQTTRYTVFGWRKQVVFLGMQDWLKRQRYMVEHCDLKETLDAEKRVVSTEWAVDYQIDTERPRL